LSNVYIVLPKYFLLMIFQLMTVHEGGSDKSGWEGSGVQ